jgi:hypothetical protein
MRNIGLIDADLGDYTSNESAPTIRVLTYELQLHWNPSISLAPNPQSLLSSLV